MRIGQIVEFCEGHHMKEWFPGKCIVLEKMRNCAFGDNVFPERYFISTICEREEDRHLTWVYEKDLEPLNEIRDSILKDLGID